MNVIGIAGYARCGKDTFVGIAKDILMRNNYRSIRMAFADKLKDEVQDMLKSSKFQAIVRSEDVELKKRIRPLMVWWGCQRRYESEGGLYWVNEIDGAIRDLVDDMMSAGEPTDRMVVLVSDVCFPNEAKWIREKWGGVVIHLKKWNTEWRKAGQDMSDEVCVKVYDTAPNEEEAIQDPLVQKMADHCVEWACKKKMTAAEAMLDPYLQGTVLNVLNNTKFFKHPSIGTLSL